MNRKDKIYHWIANHLPHRITMWAYFRVLGHATSGKFGNTVVPDITAMEAAKRWDESNEQV